MTSTRHSCDNNRKQGWRQERRTVFLLGNSILSNCFSSSSLLRPSASLCVVQRNSYTIDASNPSEVFMRYRPVCNGKCKVARRMPTCSTLRCFQQTKTTLQSPNLKAHASISHGGKAPSTCGSNSTSRCIDNTLFHHFKMFDYSIVTYLTCLHFAVCHARFFGKT